MAVITLTPDSMVDSSLDFGAPKITNGSHLTTRRTLLVAPPSIASHEERLRDLYTTYNRAATDLQMLDRLSAGLVSLPAATYDLVMVLADASSGPRPEIGRTLYGLLVPSMKSGGRFQFEKGTSGEEEKREAILAGLVESGEGFEKVEEEEVVIPLRLGAKKGNGVNGVQKAVVLDLNDDGDDELIDENELLSAEDLKRPVQIPPECQPKPGQKRRRACKDCTCGLAQQLEAEEREKQEKAANGLTALKLGAVDLEDDAIDFTVKGKTGSCGNCSLGDAFRCAGCPYIGLPPFKVGEEIRLLNDSAQF